MSVLLAISDPKEDIADEINKISIGIQELKMKQKMIDLQNDDQLVEITDLVKKVNQLMKDRDIDRKQIQELTYEVHHLKNEFRRMMEFEEVTKKLNDLISRQKLMNELSNIGYYKGESYRTQVEYEPEDKKEDNKMNLKFSFYKDKVPEGAVNLMPKSSSGRSFGEGYHSHHHAPGGGYKPEEVQMADMGNAILLPSASRNHLIGPPHVSNGPLSPVTKTRICNKFNTAEGCKYGTKCHFAHGEGELSRPHGSSYDHQFVPAMSSSAVGGLGGRYEPPPPAPGFAPATSFGASATAKISVDASLAGAIIGKGGANTKQIYRSTGAKFFIQEHESDPNLKNIEFEGTFDQIKQATTMVRDLIVNISTPASFPMNPAAGFGSGGFGAGGGSSFGAGYGGGFGADCNGRFGSGSSGFGADCSGRSGAGSSGFGAGGGSGGFAPCGGGGGGFAPCGDGTGTWSNLKKTRLCDHFNRGICIFGDGCHFAHGASELRKGA